MSVAIRAGRGFGDYLARSVNLGTTLLHPLLMPEADKFLCRLLVNPQRGSYWSASTSLAELFCQASFLKDYWPAYRETNACSNQLRRKPSASWLKYSDQVGEKFGFSFLQRRVISGWHLKCNVHLHWWAMCICINYLSSLSPAFLIWKQVVMPTPASKSCCEDSVR